MSENNIRKLHLPMKGYVRVVVDLHRATVKAILARAAKETKAQKQKVTRTDIIREVLMQWERREKAPQTEEAM